MATARAKRRRICPESERRGQIPRGACPERTGDSKRREQIPRYARDDKGGRGAQDDRGGGREAQEARGGGGEAQDDRRYLFADLRIRTETFGRHLIRTGSMPRRERGGQGAEGLV